MSRAENLIINDIKMLSLDMIKERGNGDSFLAINSAPVFYSLFMNYLNYDIHDDNWINKDRIFVNNKILPVYYASKHLFGYNISIDELKEYKLNVSNVDGDLIGYSLGVSLGERYISSLIKNINSKNKLINFHTYCVCTISDLVSGITYEALSFASKEKLKKLIIIAVNEETNNKKKITKTISVLEDLNINVINVKSNNLSSINSAIEEAKESNIPNVIIVDSSFKELENNNYNRVLTNEELELLRNRFKIENAFSINEKHYEIVNSHLKKRLNKELEKWHEIKEDMIKDDKIKEIISFLETKEIKIDFNVDNLKINDNYEEDLTIGNSKIFNILASKSPYILSVSNGNFDNNYCNIKSSKIMSVDTPTERNIDVSSTLLLGTLSTGLAIFGFKVFVSCPLIDSNLLRSFIKYNASSELDIHYIFNYDTFLNSYEFSAMPVVDEINSFRLIPKLITLRPADINEIIGNYNIIANYKKCSITIIGSGILPKLTNTNPKYVVAGGYRVKREVGEISGIIIASGTELNVALKVAEELLPFGIDMRVVSMPCLELFNNQNDRYKYALLPKDIKTFVIEFGSTMLWNKYATSEEYIFGIDRFSTFGTKEELLNKYDLNVDSIKCRIIELMK